MSNALAVATVTETIAQAVRDAVAVVPGAEVTTDLPARGGDGSGPRVNVFLYHAAPNPSLRNADLPMRGDDGTLAQRPCAPLDLYYVLSFHGRPEQLAAQHLLALTVTALHERPVLTRADVVHAIRAAPGGFLDGSDLADQPEAVRLSPLVHPVEEWSRLWTVLFPQGGYALSISIVASPVLLDGTPVPAALPVRRVRGRTGTGGAPAVEQVGAAGGGPVVAGSVLEVRGRRLAGPLTRVAVGAVVLTPDPADVSDALVRVALTDSRLQSGPNTVSVLQGEGLASDPVPFILYPTLSSVHADGAAAVVRIVPAPTGADAVTLFLNPAGAGGAGHAWAFDLPPAAPPAAVPPRLETARIPTPGLAPGTYLARVAVSGVQSPLRPASGPDGWSGPLLVVP